MQRINKKRAFTLVELMIVTAILIILTTAILLSFGTVNDTAQADVILANLQVLRTASSASFSENDKYAMESAKHYWRSSQEDRAGYQPLLFPEDPQNSNAKKAQNNAKLIDIPIAKYAMYENWNFANIVPGHGKDPHSNKQDAYFIGIKADPNITIKTAEIALLTKGTIWAVIDPSYYVAKPYSTPNQDIGHRGGSVFADPNSPSRQAWERDIVNNPSNLSRLVFFYRIPID